MQQLAEQLKTMIHHILHRYKFYRLEIDQYHEILELLGQPQTDDPRLIQQFAFRGIVAFNKNYKDQIAPVLATPPYQHISLETKGIVHKILHEFHFLNCIKAYEMFQERFQQPASLSQGRENTQNLPFDDEFEKARLHHMYYGPYSIYHMSMNGIAPQQSMTMPYTQAYFPPPPTDSYPNEDFVIPRSQDSEFKPNIRTMGKIVNEKDMFTRNQQAERHYGPTRGRPPKDKKKLLQRYYSRKISEPLNNILRLYHDKDKILEEKDERLQNCVCRGFFGSNEVFACSQCNRHFHFDCCGNNQICLGCNLKTKDPYHKVTETLGLFYLDWWDTFTFEQQINMKTFEKICSTGRFQVMVSCIQAHQQDITWPDGAVFSINGENIFETPPLLVDHQLKRRKDTGYFITPYIFQQKPDSACNLEKMKFTLEASPPKSSGKEYRDNRRGIFLLGIFLIEKLTIQKLTNNILNDNRNSAIINPLERDMGNQDELQIDHLTVSCYDPYTKHLIETPVRGKCCQHINCFDLQTFLMFEWNSPERHWRCPICRKDARSLLVDKFQLRILQEIKDLSKLPHRVTYYKSGKIDLEQGNESASSSQSQSQF